MSILRARHDSETFSSPKCVVPIPATNSFVRSALVAASLDGAVHEIDLLPPGYVPPGCGDGIVIDRDDGRFALDVVPARPLVDVNARRLLESAWRSLKLGALVLTQEDFGRERYATAARIWSHRSARVPTDVGLQILAFLQDGPLSIAELLRLVRSDRDPLAALCALACAGQVVIDIDQRFGPSTTARSR